MIHDLGDNSSIDVASTDASTRKLEDANLRKIQVEIS